MNNKIAVFDSTLRDGAQGEGVNFSVSDKIAIVKSLDELGVEYIEAGNPSSNPKDLEFFERIKSVRLFNAKLVAFGSTRRKNSSVHEDIGCNALICAQAPAVCIFGKSWDMQVTDVLHTTLEENLRMITDTIRFLKSHDKEVVFDAEHFFDGYKRNADYALITIKAAVEAGASTVVLCDTNGATLPDEVFDIVADVRKKLDDSIVLGIHCHNDTGCAVANTIMAVNAGVRHIQGTYLGFGERCGNANLSTLIADLQLKKNYYCIPPQNIENLTKTAKFISETSNIHLEHTLPFVGKSAFAHKGGMHVDGICKTPLSFEHITPETVGNYRHILLSEMSGRSAIATKLSYIDNTITRDSPQAVAFSEKLKELEHIGYQFETAQASLELLMLKHLGKFKPFFSLEYFKVMSEQPAAKQERSCSVVVKVRVGDSVEINAAEGDGPIHALDVALRKALDVFYPSLKNVRLSDYKVRVLNPGAATAAYVRVIIESTDSEHHWTTVGVSTDIIDASWKALVDSIEYKLVYDMRQ